MAKYNIYAVAYGVNPQSKEPVFNLKFRTWEDCKPFVVGVEGAKYKGFLTDTEADAWLSEKVAEILKNGNPEKDPNPEIKQNDLKEDVKKLTLDKIHPVDKTFMLTCKSLGLSVNDTEHMIKQMFVDIVKYLDDNNCINDLPFN